MGGKPEDPDGHEDWLRARGLPYPPSPPPKEEDGLGLDWGEEFLPHPPEPREGV